MNGIKESALSRKRSVILCICKGIFVISVLLKQASFKVFSDLFAYLYESLYLCMQTLKKWEQ